MFFSLSNLIHRYPHEEEEGSFFLTYDSLGNLSRDCDLELRDDVEVVW